MVPLPADFFLIITYVPNVRDMQQISPNFACETLPLFLLSNLGVLIAALPNDSISGTKSGMGRERRRRMRIKSGRATANGKKGRMSESEGGREGRKAAS